ncbi:MAG: diguanylate cyclase [Alphaproteobacteria bacterium]|jgi:diguanylate cyclase
MCLQSGFVWERNSVDPSDAIDQSRELARLAIDLLDNYAIPADPRTFTLGYAYFDGTNPELKTEVDHLIAANAFNRRSCGRLYEEIFGLDAEARAIRDASGMIEHTLGRVLETMNQAGKDVESYGKVLDDFNGKVGEESAGAGTDIRGAIESIMAETRKMAMQTTTLEKRFADSSDEIVELRRNLDEMRTAATTDALTGIANRKHFDIRIREYTDDCARNGEPLTLLMGDVDHFKNFNDEHGHQVGDMVLRLVARPWPNACAAATSWRVMAVKNS